MRKGRSLQWSRGSRPGFAVLMVALPLLAVLTYAASALAGEPSSQLKASEAPSSSPAASEKPAAVVPPTPAPVVPTTPAPVVPTTPAAGVAPQPARIPPAAPARPVRPGQGPGPAAVAKPAEPQVPKVSDPQAVAIVETYLKAIGTRETLAKIKDRTTKFINTKSQATGDTDVEINLFIKRLQGESLGIREEWDVKGYSIKEMPLAFTQIYNGAINEGWVLMMGTVSALDGKTLQVFVWDKPIDDFFCRWEEDGYILALGGQGIVGKEIMGEDQPCDIVAVTDFVGRQSSRYYFSRANGLLLKKEWQDSSTSPKGAMKKEQYFKDYRELAFLDNSGLTLKFPLRVEIYQDGDLDTVRRYTSVLFNSGLSDKIFEKPEGKPFEKAFPQKKSGEEPKGEKKETPSHGRRKPGIQRVTPEGEGTTPLEKPVQTPAPPAGAPPPSTPPASEPTPPPAPPPGGPPQK